MQLDGLRALAVLAVLVHHTMPTVRDRLNPGAAGVRLFFVLSGFLITGILLRARAEAAAAGQGRLRVLFAFYARRALRIFPIYYLMLLLAAWLGLPEVRATLAWHLAYLSNHFVAARGSWPPAPLGHLWSLAVEEQFYLLWPTLVLFAPARRLTALFAAPVLLAPLCRLLFAWLDGNPLRAGVLTATCLDSLGLGALLALLRERGAPTANRLASMGLWLGLPLLAAVTASSLLEYGGLFRIVAKDLAYALLSVWLVDRARAGMGGRAGRLLTWRPLVYLGTISYGVYLLHDFVRPALRALGLGAWLPTEGGWLQLLCVTGLTLPTAALSWHLFEKPLNDLKRHFPYVRKLPAKNNAVAAVTSRPFAERELIELTANG